MKGLRTEPWSRCVHECPHLTQGTAPIVNGTKNKAISLLSTVNNRETKSRDKTKCRVIEERWGG